MPVFRLSKEIAFPRPELANEDEILAIDGDLSPQRLILAYQNGIFPWYSDDEPIIWWSPDPRCVLFPDDLKVSKSMRRFLSKEPFTFSFDRNFNYVIRACQSIPRAEQEGTWITEEMLTAYTELHKLGLAHSVEVWDGKELVGGLYGVSLGSCFFGESMFSRVSNASKAAFIFMVQQLKSKGFGLIDCQVYNDHLASLGAIEIPRAEFLTILTAGMQAATIQGNWGEAFNPNQHP